MYKWTNEYMMEQLNEKNQWTKKWMKTVMNRPINLLFRHLLNNEKINARELKTTEELLLFI